MENYFIANILFIGISFLIYFIIMERESRSFFTMGISGFYVNYIIPLILFIMNGLFYVMSKEKTFLFFSLVVIIPILDMLDCNKNIKKNRVFLSKYKEEIISLIEKDFYYMEIRNITVFPIYENRGVKGVKIVVYNEIGYPERKDIESIKEKIKTMTNCEVEIFFDRFDKFEN